MKLLRVPELAALLGLSPSWIYKASMRDEIPRRYLGGALVFDEREIAEWIKQQPRRRKKSRNGPAPSGTQEQQ